MHPAGTGSAVLGGLLRSDPGIPVLRSIWKTFSACVFGLFRRGVIVEKNLLWYNQCMGKRRRSTEFKNNSQVIDMEQARKQRLEKRRAERAKEEAKGKQEAMSERELIMTGILALALAVVVALRTAAR